MKTPFGKIDLADLIGDAVGDAVGDIAEARIAPIVNEALGDLDDAELDGAAANLESAAARIRARNTSGKRQLKKASQDIAEVLAVLAPKFVTD